MAVSVDPKGSHGGSLTGHVRVTGDLHYLSVLFPTPGLCPWLEEEVSLMFLSASAF